MEAILGNRSAMWENLGPFEPSNIGRTVTAEILPTSQEIVVTASRRGKLVLPTMDTDAGELSITLNAMRTGQSVGNQNRLN